MWGSLSWSLACQDLPSTSEFFSLRSRLRMHGLASPRLIKFHLTMFSLVFQSGCSVTHSTKLALAAHLRIFTSVRSRTSCHQESHYLTGSVSLYESYFN